ncbi:MAG: ComF family protein [Candidatus Neomarinimicrobiota bacterium]|nr:MAG: ComF family protein [Candidatus Neomarinimicrobiota bacterium]
MRPIWEAGINLLFPPFCFHCHTWIDEKPAPILCHDCRSRLVAYGHADLRPEILHRDGIDRVYSGWEYGPEIQTVIHSLKYEDYAKFGFMYGQEVIRLLPDGVFSSCDQIVPVPLHPTKQRDRGYNQSDWIARGVSEATGIPVNRSLLRRTKFTRSQTTLNAAERKRNMENAFTVHGKTLPEHVLIVDDVITTGSTVSSLACVLKQNGVRSVSVLTLSHPRD